MIDVYLPGFLAVVGFVVFSAVWAIERIPSSRRQEMSIVARHPRIAAVVWLIGSATPTITGVLAPSGPVPPQIVMVVVAAIAIWFALSQLGLGIAASTPLFLLVGFQGFRLPLEIVLHGWVEAGVAPPQMTWSGSNPDIVIGILALLAIPFVRRWPRFAWVPTVAGLVFLLNVIRVAVLSIPGPLLAFAEPITLPNRFPHVWIATVCVMGALAGHLIAVRALLALPARPED